jgi:hypothetical protein
MKFWVKNMKLKGDLGKYTSSPNPLLLAVFPLRGTRRRGLFGFTDDGAASLPVSFVPEERGKTAREKGIRRSRGAVGALLLLPLIGLWGIAARGQEKAKPDAPLTPEQTTFFEAKVRPLLSKNCYSCHGNGATKGGLSLSTKAGWQAGGVIVPHSPAQSLLLQRVKSNGSPMPPRGKMADSDIAILEEWIKMGAPDPRITSAVQATASGKPMPGELGVKPGALQLRMTGVTEKGKQHWAFKPLLKPAVPKVVQTAWVKNSIDSFVLAKLEQNGMKPSEPASRATLIRRVYYDMIGLPPTVEEVRAFIADKSPNAYEKVVDKLLASPQYGERWGRHWLDSARYADTTGLTMNAGKNQFLDFRYENAWTYRDWVIGAINKDVPYNQFLERQLAADLLPDTKGKPAEYAALGFLTVGKRFVDGNDQIDERIDTVSKAMLGVTAACARCHDHPFDPIPTQDYYAMHGVLGSIREPDALPLIPGTGDISKRAEYDAEMEKLLAQGRSSYYTYLRQKQQRFYSNATGFLLARCYTPRSKEWGEVMDKYNLNVQRDRGTMAAIPFRPDDPVTGPLSRLARLPKANFPTMAPIAIQRMLKTGQVNPSIAQALQNLKPKNIEDVAIAYGNVFQRVSGEFSSYVTSQQANKVTSTPNSELLNIPFEVPQASEFGDVVKLKKMLEAFGRDNGVAVRFPFNEINTLNISHPGAPGHAMVVEDSLTPTDSRVLYRGERQRPGDVVSRGGFSMICAKTAPVKEGSGRLELAKSITAPGNALPARVIVNRVWMHHFGQGFVRTADDLGNQSEPPSHPELLEFLTARFTEEGWSQKKLHKWILLSNTYQQATNTNANYEKRDPQNRLLWRANLRRLDFEAIRDTMVALTGKMDMSLGGKPVNITDEPYIYRRSIYGYVDRTFLSDLLTQFDFSDPDGANSGRISTIVPQQALFFMNSAMAVDVARQVANRPEVASAKTEEERVKAIYLTLFQRSPSSSEVQMATKFLAQAELDEISAINGNTSTSLVKPAQTGTLSRQDRRAAAKVKPQAAGRGKFAPIQNNTERVERDALTPTELYTQALLCANEFVYVN